MKFGSHLEVTCYPRCWFVRPDGTIVPLREGHPNSKYSDFYLSTMQDVVTVLAALLGGVVRPLDAEVDRQVRDDPWLQRNEYGIWSEWDR